jgi:hypothetical protein
MRCLLRSLYQLLVFLRLELFCTTVFSDRLLESSLPTLWGKSSTSLWQIDCRQYIWIQNMSFLVFILYTNYNICCSFADIWHNSVTHLKAANHWDCIYYIFMCSCRNLWSVVSVSATSCYQKTSTKRRAVELCCLTLPMYIDRLLVSYIHLY